MGIRLAGERGTQMLVFPELALTGYSDQTHENGQMLNVLSKTSKMHYKLAETFPSKDIHAASNEIAALCKKYYTLHPTSHDKNIQFSFILTL